MSLDIGLTAMVETCVVSKNITHNLIGLWKNLGIYEALYLSEGKKAKEVLPILEQGLGKLLREPERYKQFDSPNGWGTYVQALPWLAELVEEFKKYPDGVIWISK